MVYANLIFCVFFRLKCVCSKEVLLVFRVTKFCSLRSRLLFHFEACSVCRPRLCGARNKLHTRTTEKIPIITEGKGIAATKNQEHSYARNDGSCIYRPEEHWNGATKTQLSLTLSITGQPNQ